MKQLKRIGRKGFAALAAATFAMVGLSQVTTSAATTITLTEEDYFNTPGQISALAQYNKQFEATHPGVKITRTYVPFASLDTKLLTQAAGHDLPNLLAVDNPFVSTMVSTGQVVPLSGFSGFSTKGYFPAIIDEGLTSGKYYSLPVAGANSIALMYNIAMLKAAKITPPATWAQLVTDAKALTTSAHYGIALTCEAAEDTTWQWEPFFWSDGGAFNFSNIASAPGVQALSLWNELVTDGSASKACLNWSQTPAASSQFEAGKAAMMVNGPWNFSGLAQAHMYYGKQFGIVPVPVRVPGQHVIVPLGGEDWMIGNSGGSAAQQMAFQWIQGMQTPTQELALAKLFGYLPPKEAVAKTYVKEEGAEWSVYANQTLYAHPRTLGLGTKYPKVSEAVWTAIQAALSGSASVQSALSTASGTIKGILNS
ncbi:MAG TPA: extracellular solute-binding protein [Acidimicrobiales bacterium]|nr:extracellular solute-binding protein [Acidimicrobiales bacterium]